MPRSGYAYPVEFRERAVRLVREKGDQAHAGGGDGGGKKGAALGNHPFRGEAGSPS